MIFGPTQGFFEWWQQYQQYQQYQQQQQQQLEGWTDYVMPNATCCFRETYLLSTNYRAAETSGIPPTHFSPFFELVRVQEFRLK